MSPTAATLRRECRSFCKILSVDNSRCLYAAKNPLPFVYPNSMRSLHRVSRRLLHTARVSSSTREAKDKADRKLKDNLRALLRDVAQPVAVVTSFMPSGSNAASTFKAQRTVADEAGAAAGALGEGSRYHGATLSSFTSIAMDPYPLVAFALRIPSRMAASLSSLVDPSPPPSSPIRTSSPLSSSPVNSSSKTSSPHSYSHPYSSHMVINLLSASQAAEAITFSRPDLYPTPFSSPANPDGVAYSLSPDGLPILRGVVGALSCRLVGPPIPLHDLSYFAGTCTRLGEDAGAGVDTDTGCSNTSARCEPVLDEGAVTSELFIAQVMRVEDIASDSDSDADADRTLPLVYHRQRYTSCHPNTI